MIKILTLALIITLASATASAQNIADVARKERERRAKLAKRARVLTNEDLQKIRILEPPETAPLAGAPAAPAELAPVAVQSAPGERSVDSQEYLKLQAPAAPASAATSLPDTYAPPPELPAGFSLGAYARVLRQQHEAERLARRLLEVQKELAAESRKTRNEEEKKQAAAKIERVRPKPAPEAVVSEKKQPAKQRVEKAVVEQQRVVVAEKKQAPKQVVVAAKKQPAKPRIEKAPVVEQKRVVVAEKKQAPKQVVVAAKKQPAMPRIEKAPVVEQKRVVVAEKKQAPKPVVVARASERVPARQAESRPVVKPVVVRQIVREQSVKPNVRAARHAASHKETVAQASRALPQVAVRATAPVVSAKSPRTEPSHIRVPAGVRKSRAARVQAAAALAANTHMVRVERGDSLWRLAAAHLGRGSRWTDIARVNPQLTNPNLIFAGSLLQLPDSPAASASVRPAPRRPA